MGIVFGPENTVFGPFVDDSRTGWMLRQCIFGRFFWENKRKCHAECVNLSNFGWKKNRFFNFFQVIWELIRNDKGYNYGPNWPIF